MDLKDIEGVLDLKLEPLIQTIKRLEAAQEDIVKILQAQSRTDETLKHVQASISRCDVVHTDLYTRIRGVEDKTSDRMWQALFAVGAGSLGGLAGHLGEELEP